MIAVLTVLTQLGGLAWIVTHFFQRKIRAFIIAYAAISMAALLIAPQFGRVALPCFSGDSFRMHSPLYCAMNRQYVVPELRDVLSEAAANVATEFPGTKTLVLDAGFPFVGGFPLLPHLSHDDGEKADIAFFYQNEEGYLVGKSRSPIGYLAFENGPTPCPPAWATLRWNATPLQGLWPDRQLEPDRTRFILKTLARDPRVGKLFIEPHLKTRLQITDGKVRFQGCRAARHDDHIHVQL